MTLFKGKYRIESARLKGWDYTAVGYYFVTICTKNREPFFGEIRDDICYLSSIGEIIAEEWLKTESLRANIQLDHWIVMPDHIHGIIVIMYQIKPSQPPQTKPPQRGGSTSRLYPNSLGSIIGQFKGACTKRIWKAGYTNFRWQSRFHNHIIRNEEALQKARAYIINNPATWETDRKRPSGVFM